MAMIAAAEDRRLAELGSVLQAVEESMGFVPNSMLAMARVPGLPEALGQLAGVVLAPGKASAELKGLVALMVSRAAGCHYCQAHTAHRAHHALGVPEGKIQALWAYRTAPEFDQAERAALGLALGAGHSPCAVTDEEVAALREHFDDDQIAELVAVIALFGFLNRWNDTLGTELEAAPRAFARDALGGLGWTAGKHGD